MRDWWVIFIFQIQNNYNFIQIMEKVQFVPPILHEYYKQSILLYNTKTFFFIFLNECESYFTAYYDTTSTLHSRSTWFLTL